MSTRNLRILFSQFLILLSAFVLFVHPVIAEEGGREQVIIVLDASGSMWGQIENEPKIAIAKSVVRDLLSDWNPDVEVGLTVYGHRKKADCQDIEMLVPPGPLNKDAFVAAVDGLNPKGKTPLTAAVLRAAETLKFTENRATVVLVSDGVETCDLDPCAVSRDMEAKGLDFTAHVIGFDVSKEEDIKQLKCVADNTGGKFLPAKDAEGLKSSLAEVVEEVVKVQTVVSLFAVNEAGGDAVEGVTWRVERAGEIVHTGGSSTPRYSIEPGSYTAIVRTIDGETTSEVEFEVLEGEQKRVEVLIAQQGKLELLAVNKTGETPLEDVRWEVFAAPSQVGAAPERLRFGRGATPVYSLEPGKYQAKVFSRNTDQTASAEVEVKAGEQSRYELVLAKEGVLELVAVLSEGAEPLTEVKWTVSDLAEKRKALRYGRGATPSYTMLPGTYYAEVKSRDGRAVAGAEVTVVAGEKRRVEVVLAEEGILELFAVDTPGGEPLEAVSFKVYDTPSGDAKPKLIAYGRGATPTHKLLPGAYDVTARSTQGKAEARMEIEVLAGQKNRVEVLLAKEGLVFLKAVTEPGGEPREEVAWKIVTIESDPMKKAKSVTYGKGDTPEYQLIPGKYLAQVRSRKGKFEVEQEIEVIAGKRTEIEVLVPKEGMLALKPVTEVGGEALQGIRWTVYDIPSDIFKKAKSVAYGGGSSPEFILLPGKYTVKGTSKKGKATAEQEVEVLPGARTEVEVVFPLEGIVKLEAMREGTGDSVGRVVWNIYTVETDPLKKPKIVISRVAAAPEYQLLPGRYLVKARQNQLGEIEQEIEVLAGEKVTAKFVFK